MSEGLLTEKAAADWLGMSVKTLQAWRWRKRGPAFCKLAGGAVRYRRQDLEAFVCDSMQQTRDTVEQAAG